MSRRSWVGGNWKCNGTKATVETLSAMMADGAAKHSANCDIVCCPTNLHIPAVLAKVPAAHVATQNISLTGNGAFTGEVSGEMLKDFGLNTTLVGHSERRARYGDTDEVVAGKVEMCQKMGLQAIVCIGETLEEREANKTIAVLERQMNAVMPKISDWSKIVVAYEPVWAIGTGKVATTEQAQEAHAAVRKMLEKVSADVAAKTRIVYGGSVTPENCEALIGQTDVDGFLVGGASLKPGFLDIIAAAASKSCCASACKC